MTATVLLSGGIDSAACAHYLMKGGYSVTAVFVDHGQLAASRERLAAQSIASYYGLPLVDLPIGITIEKTGTIQGRNAFLVLAAFVQRQIECGIIALGIHSGTSYWDCSAEFVAVMQNLLDGYTAGRVKLNCPFLDWTKRHIWDYCIAEAIPMELTYSCEAGVDPPCGKCLSCNDRSRLSAG